MPKTSSEPTATCKRTTLHGPTMGTRWSASLDADASADLAALRQDLAAAVQQVDQQMSPWKPDSDLMRLNHAPVDTWVNLPAELLEVLTCALDIHRLSAGAFDPGVGRWWMPGVLARYAIRPTPPRSKSRARPRLARRTRPWNWIGPQVASASTRRCNSTCAALPRATPWTAWPPCCSSMGCGMPGGAGRRAARRGQPSQRRALGRRAGAP
jgi:hypothetical protein